MEGGESELSAYLHGVVLEQVPALVCAKNGLADSCWVDVAARKRGVRITLHVLNSQHFCRSKSLT